MLIRLNRLHSKDSQKSTFDITTVPEASNPLICEPKAPFKVANYENEVQQLSKIDEFENAKESSLDKTSVVQSELSTTSDQHNYQHQKKGKRAGNFRDDFLYFKAGSQDKPLGNGKIRRKVKAEKKKAEERNLFCLCRGIDDGIRPMIQCDFCEDWFHFECIGLDPVFDARLTNRLKFLKNTNVVFAKSRPNEELSFRL
jgi:hypothetical protein